MPDLNFETRDPSDHDQQAYYGGVDWLARQRYDERRMGMSLRTLWVVIVEGDDKYEQQITQNNAIIHTTTASDNSPLDHILIKDERDGRSFGYFRSEIECFETIFRTLAGHSTFIITPWPDPALVKEFDKRSIEDAGIADDHQLLSQWLHGGDPQLD